MAKEASMHIPWPVPMLCAALQSEVELNELALRAPGGPLRFRSMFHRPEKPEASIAWYLLRIVEQIDCSENCYVLAFIYLQRFLQRCPKLRVDAFSVHHLIFVCFVVAVKFLHNTGHKNSFYGRVGCLPLDLMNRLEVAFLVGVNYRLFVSIQDVNIYTDILRAKKYKRCPPAPARIFYHPPEEEEKAKQQQKQCTHRLLWPHEIVNPHTLC